MAVSYVSTSARKREGKACAKEMKAASSPSLASPLVNPMRSRYANAFSTMSTSLPSVAL